MTVPPTTIACVAGMYKGRTATVSQPRFTIGRNREHVLCFPFDLAVSRDHATFSFEEGEWNVCDLGSSNGTWLNGQRLMPYLETPLQTGDHISCGGQTLKISWQPEPKRNLIPPPSSTFQSGNSPHPFFLRDGVPTSAPPTEPVLLGRAIPSPGSNPIPVPSGLASGARKGNDKPYRWVNPGEAVEVHGRKISAGLFWFGTSMEGYEGWSPEPSLIDPTQEVARENPADQVDLEFGIDYSSFSPNSRAAYLDWLAANRPVETMTDANALLFLAGIERFMLLPKERDIVEYSYVQQEIQRLYEGATVASLAWVRLREFLFVAAICLREPAEALFSEMDLGRLTGPWPIIGRYQLSQKGAAGKAFGPRETLMTLLLHGMISPRTPFFRCEAEVLQVFDRLFRTKYKKGIVPRPAERLFLEYFPINREMPTMLLPDVGLRECRIGSITTKRVVELMNAATDALDAYSRRIGMKPGEQGKLPALALCPSEVLVDHPVIRTLAEIAANAPNGRVPCGQIAEHWVGWPEKTLSKPEHINLAKAFWAAGFVMEPHHSGSTGVAANGAVFVAPRLAKDTFAASAEYLAILPLLNLVASVVLTGGKGEEAKRSLAKKRLGQVFGVPTHEARRLNLHLEHLIEFGTSKKSKKSYDAVPLETRRSLLDFLAELASSDGNVGREETQEILSIAAAMGVPETEVYPLLHRSSAKLSANKTQESVINLDAVANKIASSLAAAEILSGVFTAEELAPEPVVISKDPLPGVESPVDTVFTSFLRQIAEQESWSASDFAALAKRHGKLPAGAYDELNEAAYQSVGDPLLDGDGPIFVDLSVAREMLS